MTSTRRKSKSYSGIVAVLASMHGKHRVIAPIMKSGTGLIVEVISGFDTDRFGTFTGEIERRGSQLEAARSKIAAIFDYTPEAQIALSSEGSFGPHPALPFVAIGRELVLLIDRKAGLEVAGYDITVDTTFGHVVASDQKTAFAFAKRIGFPRQGVIVSNCCEGHRAAESRAIKDIENADSLVKALGDAIERCGAVFVQSDMRAFRNPKRMRAIARATRELVARFNSLCPQCNSPGFAVVDRIPGLRCSSCGAPTRQIRIEVLACCKCRHNVERHLTSETLADPGFCDVCNP